MFSKLNDIPTTQRWYGPGWQTVHIGYEGYDMFWNARCRCDIHLPICPHMFYSLQFQKYSHQRTDLYIFWTFHQTPGWRIWSVLERQQQPQAWCVGCDSFPICPHLLCFVWFLTLFTLILSLMVGLLFSFQINSGYKFDTIVLSSILYWWRESSSILLLYLEFACKWRIPATLRPFS